MKTVTNNKEFFSIDMELRGKTALEKEMIVIACDLGKIVQAAKIYKRNYTDAPLESFIKIFKPHFPAHFKLSKSMMKTPLQYIVFQYVTLNEEQQPEKEGLNALNFGEAYEKDLNKPFAPFGVEEKNSHFSQTLSDDNAVRCAYSSDLSAISDYLKHDLSVLVVCDKMLTAPIYDYVVGRAGKRCVLETDLVEGMPKRKGATLDRMMHGREKNPLILLPFKLHNLKEDEVFVIRSLDLMNKPEIIEILYHRSMTGKMAQILAFLDPSLSVDKVLSDRFSLTITITGLPRYAANLKTCSKSETQKRRVHCVTGLMTQSEQECFKHYEPEELYKNVAGLNAIQFRCAMRYMCSKVAKGTDPKTIYGVIRQFKTSSSGEIEIPDTQFSDIGGYEHVKQQLHRIIRLMGGPIKGISEHLRNQLIPRGFIFHGPPGTGKTLFAKAIANEMNATIQMISGPEIMDKYVGESENKLRKIFATARRNAPAVIFFDEFDSIASQRSQYADGGARVNNAVVAQLLTELDGFRREQTVLVIGTTNRIDIIDEALIRPSRLKPMEIGLPDGIGRMKVAEIYVESFEVKKILRDLFTLWFPYRDEIKKNNLPVAFLEGLFQSHSFYKARYHRRQQQQALSEGLLELFKIRRPLKNQTAEMLTLKETIREQLIQMGITYGLDFTKAASGGNKGPTHSPSAVILADFQALFSMTNKSAQGIKCTWQHYYKSFLGLTVQNTEKFNNDEIRAIFQEASLEYHMEGILITPGYIRRKIDQIRSRRHERGVVHMV